MSFYHPSIKLDVKKFGERARPVRGEPNLREIIEEERTGKHIERLDAEPTERGNVLVMGRCIGDLVWSGLVGRSLTVVQFLETTSYGIH
jgi:hypothetical protein